MRRIALVAALVVTAAPAMASQLTMEKIMANPDWVGHAVERPYWSADGRYIYYHLERDGSQLRDLYRVDADGADNARVRDKDLAKADGDPVFDAKHQRAAFLRHGDVFVRDLQRGTLIQVTRTPEHESDLQWSANGSAVQYRLDNQWYSYSLSTAASTPVATLKTADDPQADKPDALERKQLDLFKTLRHIDAEKKIRHERDQALAKADPTRAPQPFWMGKDHAIAATALSPDGRWMLVVTQPAHYDDGKPSVVNHYVTFSGYTEKEKSRPYVGRNQPAPQSVWLLDLTRHVKHALSLDDLPGIHTEIGRAHV